MQLDDLEQVMKIEMRISLARGQKQVFLLF